MRRNRRNGHSGHEFGGSGEDSFVAVVVTKLTGALLFILLLTMVIMALIPKAVDLPAPDPGASRPGEPLTIATPDTLPEAIAGRPYAVALAATGGQGPLRWAVDGDIPEGLGFDPASAQLRGTPKAGTAGPSMLVLRVSDGHDRASRAARLVVYESDRPLAMPSKWKPSLPPIPYRAWLEQGFGFLILWLIHLVGMNTLANLERWSFGKLGTPAGGDEDDLSADPEAALGLRRRFALYRWSTRLATLGASIGLAAWL